MNSLSRCRYAPKKRPAVPLLHWASLWLIVLLSSFHHKNVAVAFGWLRLNTLPERLMGSRPEWHNSREGSSPTSQLQQRQQRWSSPFPPHTLQHSSSSTTLRSSSSTSTKHDHSRIVDFMNEPPNLMSADDLDPLAPLDVDTLDLLHCIVHAADGRKAQDITALKVHHVSTLTSCLVVVSGNSRPQNQAIAAAITQDVAEQFGGQRPGNSGIPEGSAESGWMLLDYGTVMVHIMTPKSRLFYNVQGQWLAKGAREIDVRNMLIPETSPQTAGAVHDNGATAPPPPKKDDEDPFWS